MEANNAWVTCATGEDDGAKALVLAGSLRRVSTSARLVVIAGKNLSVALRQNLEATFDLVLALQGDDDDDDGPHWSPKEEEEDAEAPAVLQAFSLVQFEKIVYLSPNMVVVVNCDKLFGTAAAHSTLLLFGDDGLVDPRAMLISPSLDVHQTLKQRLSENSLDHCWRSTLLQVLQAKLPPASLGKLDGKYNREIRIFDDEEEEEEEPSNKAGNQWEESAAAILNFVDAHPVDIWKEGRFGKKKKDFDTKAIGKLVRLALALGRAKEEDNHRSPGTWTRRTNEPIAIIGMGLRLPGGATEKEFWTTLMEGREAVVEVPPHRWLNPHPNYQFQEPGVKAGFLTQPIDEFDAKFFGINPKDGLVLDPQIRLLFEVTWEALEQGGIEPTSLRGSGTGIFVGSWSFNYQDLVVESGNMEKNVFRAYLGNSLGAESARLSHFFGTTGPSISTESGCTSGIVALHLAVNSLRRRECHMALAAGANLLIHPFNHKLMEGLLSPDYKCKSFDASANGFARGEGAACLVLKRLSDAVSDGDSVWGLVRGSGIAQEGHSSSLGTPTVHCEALAMELALKDAGLEPEDVNYIEAHGTGTVVGDPLEIAAIRKAYASRARQEPLVIGSVKANVGHTESVSGLVGIIKVLLALKHEILPKQLHLESLNPEIILTDDKCPLRFPTKPVEWRKDPSKSPRIAGVNCFGITGTDGHVLIQEPPSSPSASLENKDLERPLHLLKISAKSADSFQLLLEKYEELLLLEEQRFAFEDICFSANSGRASFFSHRAVILAKDSSDAARMLKDKSYRKAEIHGGGGGGGAVGSGKLCFLFTGHGSAYRGMAQELYSTSPVFRMHFDRGAQLLQSNHSISIKEAIWGTSASSSDSELLMNHSGLTSQIGIFLVEYSLLKLWESWGVRPDYVLGHSLGEFAAAVAAGALSLEDALLLAPLRGRLVDSLAPPGAMLVVNTDKATVDQLIASYTSSSRHPGDFWLDYAALNSHDQTVVAGEPEMIQDFARFCKGNRLKCMMLPSTHAHHSRHMEPMLAEYRRICKRKRSGVPGGARRPKYISGMTGQITAVEALGADYWVEHTRRTVNFVEACKTAQAEGITLFLEIGAHPVLSALVMMNNMVVVGTGSALSSVTCLPSLRRNAKDWAVLLDSLSKLYLSSWSGSCSIDWKGFDRGYSSRQRVPLPFYPFSRKRIWVELHRRPNIPSLHSLLGKLLPASPSSRVTFEAQLTSKSASYLQDHVIGSRVIFPAGCFLEMCLAAGHYATAAEGCNRTELLLLPPREPIALRDLALLAPLALEDSSSILQTTVGRRQDEGDHQAADGDGESGAPVTISRFHPDRSEWTTLATAQFHLMSPSEASNSFSSAVPDALFSPSSIPPNWERLSTSAFYQSLPAAHGLWLGPSFQLLEEGWRGRTGAVFKLKPLLLPPQTNHNHHHHHLRSHHHHLLHPAIGDAMMHAILAWRWKDDPSPSGSSRGKKSFQIPVSIGGFVLLECPSPPPGGGAIAASSEAPHPLYIYCTTTRGGSRVSALVSSGTGRTLAFMADIEFVETSVKLVEEQLAAAASQRKEEEEGPKTLRGFWEEVYRPVPDPAQNINWRSSVFAPPPDETCEAFQNNNNNHNSPLAGRWILFGDDGDTTLTSSLREKLVGLNRSAHVLERPERLDSMTESEFREFLASAMSEEGDAALEGILYLWGLPSSSCRPDQTSISLPFLTLCQLLVGMAGELGVVTGESPR